MNSHTTTHSRSSSRLGRFLLALCGVAVLAVASSGCSMYTGRFSPPIQQDTSVQLREDDFRYVDRNMRGDYQYWSLNIGYFPPLAISIPLGDPRIFSNALADMYARSQANVEETPAQMINWKYDGENLIIPIPFVTPIRHTAVFRADLIEFHRKRIKHKVT